MKRSGMVGTFRFFAQRCFLFPSEGKEEEGAFEIAAKGWCNLLPSVQCFRDRFFFAIDLGGGGKSLFFLH